MAGDVALARVVMVRADGTRETAWLIGPDPPDIEVVERLARLQLVCRRGGGRMCLEDVSERLEELLELTGLRREAGWEAESGEEPVVLEEGVDPGDPFP